MHVAKRGSFAPADHRAASTQDIGLGKYEVGSPIGGYTS